jgi:hypothetical protein
MKLVLDAYENLVRILRAEADNWCVFRNVLHLVEGVVSTSLKLLCQVKVWSAPSWADRCWRRFPLWRPHLACPSSSSPSASMCESIGDVLVALVVGFSAG